MGYTYHTMSLLPYGYARGYGYPGAYPYGPYGMTAEEIGKIREAEEKAFTEAEEKRKEFMEAEKKKYEDFVAAEKKKYEDYVAAQKKAVEEPSPRRRSSRRSSALTHMAHTAQLAHSAMATAQATVVATAMALLTGWAMAAAGDLSFVIYL